MLAASCAPVAVHAATVEIVVRGADGKPLRDAVVSITSARAAPPRPAGVYRVTQQNIAFDPFVLVVPKGATVNFPNKDKVRHQVYSFSRPKKFELKLYGRDESRTVTFDVPGTVALGCNIHDRMTAFVRVVDTPFAVKTDANGRARLDGVPEGGATLTVWHPWSLAKNGEFTAALPIPASGLVAKTITMRTGR